MSPEGVTRVHARHDLHPLQANPLQVRVVKTIVGQHLKDKRVSLVFIINSY